MARFTSNGGGSGTPGPAGQDANTADFTFVESTVSTPANMELTVEGVPGQINLSAYSGVELSFADASGSGLKFPDGTIQTTAFVEQVTSPLPEFLTYTQGREALPHINTNFGWDSNGVWFGPTAVDGPSNPSYPIFTDFTISSDTPIQVSFDGILDGNCNDIGVAIYKDGEVPNWTWGWDSTRIAAQFDCSSAELHGLTMDGYGSGNTNLGGGTYTVNLSYNPLATTENVIFTITDSGSNTVATYSLDERLPAGSYRIGFATDTDPGDGGPGSRTYIKNLEIIVNPGVSQTVYSDALTSAYSGGPTGLTQLVVPIAIKDTSGNDLVKFTKTGTGTARIESPQDDLSLRSARDITLFAGSDGPGKVYIGWGNSATDSNPQNEVATRGYVDNVLPQALGTSDSPTFDKVYAANNGSGTNIQIGDDAWIGDINSANTINVKGFEDESQGYVSMGNNGQVSIGNDGSNNLILNAPSNNIQLYMDGAAYIGDAVSDNRIAQIKDITDRISSGMVRYSPTFAATGLAFTGSGTTHPTYNSYYVKSGSMVSFVIEVDLSTVTDFGTGQYTLELPFDPAIGYNHFTGWANVDTDVNPDVTNGHVVLNVDHAGITSTLDLHYLKQAGGAHTPIIEGLFLQGTPVTLTTSSKIYVNGTYISQ